MASFPQTQKVSTAVAKRSNNKFSFDHLTTANFMDFNVAKSIELVPNQTININHDVFARLEPMRIPTLGKATIHNKAFFVPYRTIFPAWNDFITDVTHTDSVGQIYKVNNVPLIKNSVLRQLFIGVYDGGDEYYTVVTGDGNADIISIRTDDAIVRTRLTTKGKHFYKILRSLGYAIDFNQRNPEKYYSALPLLSLLKVYMDWYYPQIYANDEYALSLQYLFNYDRQGTALNFDYIFDVNKLKKVADTLYKVCYDADYFVSAWDNPVGPQNDTYSSVRIPDVTVDNDARKSVVRSDANISGGTPYIGNGTDNTAGSPNASITNKTLTQYMITALKSLNDFMKRHQLSSRVIDRYLARYGVTLSAEKLKRSVLISSYDQNIIFGDVTSTASTDNQPLGSYAGKGISYGESNNFEFSTDEYGMLIIVSTIVPKISYYQGMDRTVIHNTRLDFFINEFDNLGVQAISRAELFMPMDSRKQYSLEDRQTENFTAIDYDSTPFGFIPRYAEYKIGRDQITGDYNLNTLNTGKDAWYLGRNLEHIVDEVGVAELVHDVNFIQGDDSMQYQRIFDYTNADVDQFNILHQFTVNDSFPGSRLFDSYEYESDGKAEKVNIQVGGVRAN